MTSSIDRRKSVQVVVAARLRGVGMSLALKRTVELVGEAGVAATSGSWLFQTLAAVLAELVIGVGGGRRSGGGVHEPAVLGPVAFGADLLRVMYGFGNPQPTYQLTTTSYNFPR